MNTARLNADEFFKGHEDCIKEKKEASAYNTSLLPSDEEYSIILKEAQRQIDTITYPNYVKMNDFAETYFGGITYSGCEIQNGKATSIEAYRVVMAEKWLFVYEGVSYLAYVGNGLIYSIRTYDRRIDKEYLNSSLEISPLTTLGTIANEAIGRVLWNKKDEIKKFKKSLYELRKSHKEIMGQYEDVLNGKEIAND